MVSKIVLVVNSICFWGYFLHWFFSLFRYFLHFFQVFHPYCSWLLQHQFLVCYFQFFFLFFFLHQLHYFLFLFLANLRGKVFLDMLVKLFHFFCFYLCWVFIFYFIIVFFYLFVEGAFVKRLIWFWSGFIHSLLPFPHFLFLLLQLQESIFVFSNWLFVDGLMVVSDFCQLFLFFLQKWQLFLLIIFRYALEHTFLLPHLPQPFIPFLHIVLPIFHSCLDKLHVI